MRTAENFQKEFAGLYGSTSSHIFWDSYYSTEKEELIKKLEHLFPDTAKNTRNQNEKQKELRNILLDSIWSQRIYNAGDLLTSLLFVLVTDYVAPTANAKKETKYSIHPVFRIRKCSVNDDSNDCCMIFVDEIGRVYQNWSDYLSNNTLPVGIMVAPHSGVYRIISVVTKAGRDMDMVVLTVMPTPATSDTEAALKAIDKTSSVVSMGALAVPVAALVLPVAAPLVVLSAVGCSAAGLWSVGRSTANLVDRGQHNQSINVTDRQARSSWIGIASGAISLAASGVTQGIMAYTSTGKQISKATQITAATINGISITMNGIGVANNVTEIIMKATNDEHISTSDIMQLSASLVLFTHSIYNFRYVSNLVTESGGEMNVFRRMLGDSQRQIYDRFISESKRLITGTQPTSLDIIRSTGTIPDYQSSSTTFNAIPVLDIVARIAVRFSGVINETNLVNCVSCMVEKISEAAIDMLLEITNAFFKEFGSKAEFISKRIFPFEDILWRSFKIAVDISLGDKITPSWLKMKMRTIIIKLKEIFIKSNKQRNGTRRPCDICGGYYTITPIN